MLIVKICILSLQLMDLLRWIDSSVACMGDPYSLEVRVILACELQYSSSFIWGWQGLHFAKLQIAFIFFYLTQSQLSHNSIFLINSEG